MSSVLFPYREMYSNLMGLFTSSHLHTVDTLMVLYKHQIYSHAHIHKVLVVVLHYTIILYQYAIRSHVLN